MRLHSINRHADVAEPMVRLLIAEVQKKDRRFRSPDASLSGPVTPLCLVSDKLQTFAIRFQMDRLSLNDWAGLSVSYETPSAQQRAALSSPAPEVIARKPYV